MDRAALAQLFDGAIAPGKPLVLDAALVPAAAPLVQFLGLTSLALDGATAVTGDATALVRGTATLLGQTAAVTLDGDGDGSATWLTLSLSWPSGATFASLFGTAPMWLAWNAAQLTGPQASFLDNMTLPGCAVTIASAAVPARSLQAGINLAGPFTAPPAFAGMFAGAFVFLAAGDQVSGTVALGPTPTVDLRVKLARLPFALGAIAPASVFLWLHTTGDPTLDPESPDADPSLEPESVLELAVTTAVGKPDPIDVTIATPILAGAGGLTLRAVSPNASLANGVDDLLGLLGAAGQSLPLPSTLGAIGAAQVSELAIGLALPDSGHEWGVTFVYGAIDLGDTSWPLPLAGWKVSGLTLAVAWRPGQQPPLQATLSGSLALGAGVTITAGAEYPGFRVSGVLATTSTLAHLLPSPLADALSLVPAVGALAVVEAAAAYDDASGALALSLALDGTWGKAIGARPTFQLDSLCAQVSHDAGGWSMFVDGAGTLGGAQLSASWSYQPGGGFTLTGQAAQVPLGALVKELTGVTLSSLVDYKLALASVTITESGDAWTLALLAELTGAGTLFFELLDGGFVAGVNVTAVARLDQVPGFGFLHDLGIELEDLVLALSSVTLPATIPPPPGSTAPPVVIPSGLGAVGPGAGIYGAFRLGDPAATTSTRLLAAYRWLGWTSADAVQVPFACTITDGPAGIVATITAGVELSSDSARPTRPGPARGSGGGKLDLALYAGASVPMSSPTEAELYLRGVLTLPLNRDDPQPTFGIEIQLETDGIVASGFLLEKWVAPFGITVSQAAVVVGCDWDGVPTAGVCGELTVEALQLDGSLAVLFNSDAPLSSVFAIAISELSLATLVRLVVPDPQPLLDAIGAGVFDAVKLTDMAAATLHLTPAIVAALDHGVLDTVATALLGANPPLTISSNFQETLLITGTPGRSWYLVDRRCSGSSGAPVHYELSASGDQLTIAFEPQLYVAPAAVTIGGPGAGAITYAAGIAVYGQLDLFGITAALAVQVTFTSGFIPTGLTLEARLSPISLFGGGLTLTRATGDTFAEAGKGPYLSIDTATTTASDGTSVPPHIAVSGQLDLLGAEAATAQLLVTASGLALHLDVTVDQGSVTGDLVVHAWPPSLSGSATAALSLAFTLPLPGLGQATYAASGVALTLDLAVALDAGTSEVSIAADGALTLEVPIVGALGPYTLPTIKLSANLDKLAALAIAEIEKLPVVGDLVKKLLADADIFARLVKQEAIKIVGELPDYLRQYYGTSSDSSVSSCMSTTLLRDKAAAWGVAPATAGDQLNALRQLRTDLTTDGGPMGAWIVNLYLRMSQSLVALYHQNPTATLNGTPTTFQQMFDAYDGQHVFADLTAAVGDASHAVAQQSIANFEYIVVGALYYVTKGSDLEVALGALSTQVSAARQQQQPAALTYAALVKMVAGMSAPPDPFDGGTAT